MDHQPTHPTPSSPARFVPASTADLSTYARSLAWLLDLPLQAAQALLATIWGHADLHALQQVLKKKHVPGPYLDKAEPTPRRSLKSLETSNAHLVQSIVAAYRESSGQPVQPRDQLVAEAGLFFSPAGHKRAMKRLRAFAGGESVADESGMPVGFHALLAALYPFWERLVPAPSGLDFAVTSPNDHILTLASYREPDIFLALTANDLSGDPHPNLPDVQNDYYRDGDESWRDLFAFYEGIHDGLVELYRRKASAAGGAGGDLSDDEHEALSLFLNHPSPESAAASIVASSIPDVARLVQQARVSALQDAAQSTASNRRRIALIQESTSGPLPIACSILFEEVSETADDSFGSLRIWRLNGTFMQKQASGDNIVFASVEGYQVVLHDGNDYVHPDDLLWGMDSVSAMLNDAWKVFTFEYCRNRLHGDMYSFADAHPFQDIAILTFNIIPAFRGQGLLQKIVWLYEKALANYPYNVADRGWREKVLAWSDDVPIEEVDVDLIEEDDDDERPVVLNAPGLIIFPIEGTRPEVDPIFAWAAVASVPTDRREVRNRSDAAVELRKARLTEHFYRLDQEDADIDADIICYDPWDYPIT